ncbi:putative kinase [Kineococcus radiotolerans]|uniref:Putative kinase n=1 Tax=Kineococcus radiotolerans TaxID=131568 RepID=A0A7W4TQX2_KINRA|nr:ATP-binding protein [Kineococcus radiotolerans]MBB2903058.1 putative kinase [Kineococcus radiotolerans]
MRTPTPSPAALLITGTVGSGKTTTAEAVAALLREEAIPHAVVDLDALGDAWPSPPDDPFHEHLVLANLHAVARNHLAAGALRLVLAGVLEDPAHRPLYERAAGAPLTVCRLRVDLPHVHDRLRRRHGGDREALDWHLHRSGELDAVLDAAGGGDVEVAVAAGQAPSEVALAVVRAVGWDTGRA